MRIKTIAENRKNVVKAMEDVLNVRARYLGPPTFSYVVGSFTVDREGNIDTESEEEGIKMQNELVERGIAEGKRIKMNIELPMEGFTPEGLKNLIYLIHSKQYLLEKAVGVTALKVTDVLVEKLISDTETDMEKIMQTIGEEETIGLAFREERIQFNGFPFSEEAGNVYCQLVAAMVKTAKEQKKINPKETIEENEKYYMRSWLVRLGFDGKEGKEVRQVLLARLKGHTAFRTEADREKWKAKNYDRKKGANADEIS